MSESGHQTKVFWSGGSQAVRLPKAMRLDVAEVIVRKRGSGLLIEPVPESDDWQGFWGRLAPLPGPVRRHATRKGERRRAV
jgi:antitoxin VapB